MLKLGAIICGLLFCTNAMAFGSVDLFGQSREHEKITRLALKAEGFGAKTLSSLAGNSINLGAVSTPDFQVKSKQDKAAAHCDGADFLDVPDYPNSRDVVKAQLIACRDYIFRTINQAITSAEKLVDESGQLDKRHLPLHRPCFYLGVDNRAKCEVLLHFGHALHASQDFYAHSNWNDRARDGAISSTNPPGLGREGVAPFIDMRIRAAYPKGLISGCYEGFPEKYRCKYSKIKHRIRHMDLSKDNGEINVVTGKIGKGRTPRGAVNGNFRRAVSAAIEDTQRKWLYIKSEVLRRYGDKRGRLIVCAVTHDLPHKTCQ